MRPVDHGIPGLDSVPDPGERGSRSAPGKTALAMKTKDNPPAKLRDGARCKVVGGTHAGKAGTVTDINKSKSGFITLTVVQANGERFKTLAKNVVIP